MKAGAAIWHSPFRPFFLLGALYGPLLILSWVPQHTGLISLFESTTDTLPSLWHQHEIIYGFATAIIFGFILTALPSWAGTTEIKGPRLALLVSSWLLGRVAIIFASKLPLPLVAVLDLSFPFMFLLMLRPELHNVPHRISLGLNIIITGFFAGNLCYYLGIFQQDMQLWQQGLRIGLYAMIFHCSVTVGILAPIFTENALQERGQMTDIGHRPLLEWLSALSILILAWVDISAATAAVSGAVALISCLLHVWRLARWRSMSILNTPIVWVLHAGYLWLAIALLLRALSDFGMGVVTESWVHAFTVGGFGLMSLGLMTRVTLRHTGRELQPEFSMVLGYILLALAALLRVVTPITSLAQELLMLSAVLWVAPYLLYLKLYGRLLLTPSLPECDK